MKKGEPGATDNPDDAQRLREDYSVRIPPGFVGLWKLNPGEKWEFELRILGPRLDAPHLAVVRPLAR